ncbi:MAG: hypothetical protein ACOC1K_05370 [Nanoarchaeota archaeon]
MKEETRKTLRWVGILWFVLLILMFIVSFSQDFFNIISIEDENLLIILFFIPLGIIPLIFTSQTIVKKLSNFWRKHKVIFIIICVIFLFALPFLFLSLTYFAEPIFVLFFFLLFIIYMVLWLIPIYFSSIRPLFISMTIYFIIHINSLIILNSMVASTVEESGGTHTDLVGLGALTIFSRRIFLPIWIISFIVLLIIGIVLSIRKYRMKN